MRKFVGWGLRLSVCLFVAVALLTNRASGQTNAPASTLLPGQTATLLPDGRWLIAGGVGQAGPQNQAQILDTAANTSIPIPGGLKNARAWHTATVLPQGTVLILGGIDANGLVETPELFDPSMLSFQSLPISGPSPRAYHTATLLTDGHLLLAGGVAKGNGLLRDAELWDPQAGISTKLPAALSTGRQNQTAVLMANGQVLLWGGLGQNGAALQNGELYDPQFQSFTPINALPPQSIVDLRVEASLPAAGDTGVSLDSLIALRFSKILAVTTVTSATVTLIDDSQTQVPAKVIAAEGGMLAFLTPESPLVPLTTYTVRVSGPTDASNQPLASFTSTFTTEDDGSGSGNLTAAGKQNALDSTKEPDALPALQAATGITALSGRVLLSDNAQGLSGVGLELTCSGATKTVQSDNTGRFLISGVASGHCKLEIDGTNTGQKNKSYGFYIAGVDLKTGQTNVLPYFIWMTQLDTPHANTIASPTTSETVVSTPRLPGLELHLQPNTVITDYDGNVVTQLSITQIPLGRPPFPLPNVQVAFYFTIQPGGGYVKVSGAGPQGARLIYPNVTHAKPGARFEFWNYDPDQKGWYVYGGGSVSPDAKSIVPYPGVVLYSFTGAMVGDGQNTTTDKGRSKCSESLQGCKAGDPLDLGTGLFVLEKTDLALPGVMPITLARTYRQSDSVSRAFGIGANHQYDSFLIGDTFPYTFQDLILADGGRIHYTRTIACTGDPNPCQDYHPAIYEHTGTQGQFYKSRITHNNIPAGGWILTFKDGTVWNFPDSFMGTVPAEAAIISIIDRNGNSLTMSRDATTGNLSTVTSSSGRWISLSYDAANRITQAQDNSGRVVRYAYDSGGRLSSVTDPNGGVTQYAYDPNNQLMTITDPRNITYLTNYFDGNGRVIEQDQADGGIFHIAYTVDANGNITQADVTNPRGFVDRSVFDTSGYHSGGNLTSHIRAVGRPEQQTTTYQYDAAATLMLSSTDPLGRQTTFTYDSSGCGNVTGITRLAGTGNAVTTNIAYQTPAGGSPCTTVFNQVTAVTDPLGHSTTFGYDGAGKNVTSVTDALQHAVTVAPNSDGQPGSVTTFAGTVQFGYGTTQAQLGLPGDLVSITVDPANLNLTARRTLDLAGRIVRLQAPMGQITQYQYDALNQLLKMIDPLNGQTTFTYDGNGNPLTVQDANTHTTNYTPNSMDRVSSRKDPLLNLETYQYDPNGNLSMFIDRKNQIAQNAYDGLDRLIQIQFADLSTITYTYDAGNRLTQIVDSVSGAITRGFDGLDRLTSEITPQGSVSYIYDNVGRRASMTVAGQAAVNYTFDNADRLTQIAQGTATVTIGYDDANRRTALTLPNGIAASYGYDTASRLTSIRYTQAQTTIGDLAYTYDANGRRIGMGGSLARANLPAALTSATYNVNNQLTNWAGTMMNYDANGNMTYDGATTYNWDARNRLAAFGSISFSYDSFGRRTRNAAGTSILYNGLSAVQELSGSTVTANLLTGLGVDEILTRTDSAGSRNFLADALGSPIALTDSTGTTQTQYAYEPFGKATASGTTNSSTFQYTGRENDGTGLYYYRARYYHPALQRFISEDPLGFLGGLNLYGYTLNSPINLTDPLGLAGTANIGVTVSGQFGPVSGQFSAGIIIDGSNLGTYWTGGGGPGVGARWSVGVSSGVSNGRTICDASGPFVNGSLGGGLGPSASVDGYAGMTKDGYEVIGGGVTAGAGLGAGGSTGITDTLVIPAIGPLSHRKKQVCD